MVVEDRLSLEVSLRKVMGIMLLQGCRIDLVYNASANTAVRLHVIGDRVSLRVVIEKPICSLLLFL